MRVQLADTGRSATLYKEQKKSTSHLEIVLQRVANEDLVLQDLRNFFLALAQREPSLKVLRLHPTHECPEVCHALARCHVLVVAAQNRQRDTGKDA